ncbi:hypothetical protein V8B97DRAFT_2023329 [Scleroderma yunnanense]
MTLTHCCIDLIWLSESLGSMKSGLNVNREVWLLSKHLSSVTGYLDTLVIILGKGDTIALGYLPSSLAQPMQEHVLGMIYPLYNALKQSISDKSWQTSSNFISQDNHRLSSCLDFSPARHELGHSTWEDESAISSALSTNASRQALSGTLSIMHPPLYDAVHIDVSVTANHSAPLHHDPHSCANWYNLLVSVGEYTDFVLDIPTLGLQLEYFPSTHRINAITGNRYYLAYYMRDNIHNWLNDPRGD